MHRETRMNISFETTHVGDCARKYDVIGLKIRGAGFPFWEIPNITQRTYSRAKLFLAQPNVRKLAAPIAR